MEAVLVIGINYTYNENDFKNKYVVGVDKGALYCLNNNIHMDYAVGDFDSITEEEFIRISKATKAKRLNPIKDETDTFEAIELCKDYDKITILGGILGKRIEHFVANMIMLRNYPKVCIKDDNSYIITVCDSFKPYIEGYHFISLFSIEDSVITLKNMKYSLDNYKLLTNDPLGVSNEFNLDSEIIIHSGRLMVIYSKDDSL